MSTVSETEIAWAAGLFEGEGCLWEMNTPALAFSYLGFGVEMTDEEVIRRFHRFLVEAGVAGKSKVTTRWRGNEKHARQYAVRLSGSRAEQAYLLLRPFLGERRRAKGDSILAKRQEQLAAATVARECRGCGEEFLMPPMSQGKVWCSSECYHRVMAKTPRGRALANERSRRYKQRQRLLRASQPDVLF